MKYIANWITSLRIVGAILLLCFKPFSIIYFIIYGICGISDIMDGYMARKTKTESRMGEVLDSIADMIFLASVTISLILSEMLPTWIWVWIVFIAFIRFFSYIIGFARFHSFSSLHTYANKFTGLLCFCFPILIIILGVKLSGVLLCSMAFVSAMEELVIIITTHNLNRNIKGFVYYKWNKKD